MTEQKKHIKTEVSHDNMHKVEEMVVPHGKTKVEEKNNQIDLTDKGIAHLSEKTNNDSFFVLPDIGVKIGEIDESENDAIDLKQLAYEQQKLQKLLDSI